MVWEIKQRTFEAKKHPKGSEERKELNRNPLTSEYGSDKFALINEDMGFYESHKTRHSAEFSKQEKLKYS